MSDTSALGKVSFVVPCFCSESTLEGVVDEIFQVMEPFGPFEIVLVNDASRDDTSTVLAKLAATHKNVKTIELSRNFGQHSAWMAGFRFITGDTVVIIEDDGQTPIDELPSFSKDCVMAMM